MTTLTKARIAEAINEKIGLSLEDSMHFVDAILKEMQGIIVESFMLKVSSFGTFRVLKKRCRIGRNPKTLEKVLIKERNVIVFRPSLNLKRIINNEGV